MNPAHNQTPNEDHHHAQTPQVDSEKLSDSLKGIVEGGIEHFCHSLSLRDGRISPVQLEAIKDTLHAYILSLERKEAIDTLTSALPQLLEHTRQMQKPMTQEVFELIHLGVHSGTLTYLIPSALKANQRTLSVLCHRLKTVSDNIPQSTLRHVSLKAIPTLLIEADGELSVFDFDKLCDLLTQSGPLASELIDQFAIISSLTSSQITLSHQLSIISELAKTYDFEKIIHALPVAISALESLQPPEDSYTYFRCMHSALSVASSWPHDQHENTAKSFRAIFSQLNNKLDIHHISRFFSALNAISAADIPQYLECTARYAPTSNLENLISYVSFTQEWLSQIDRKNMWQFMKYVAGGISSQRFDEYKNIMSALHRALGGMFRTSRYLSQLDDALQRLSRECITEIDGLSYELPARIDQHLLNNLPEQVDALDYLTSLILCEGHESAWKNSELEFSKRYQINAKTSLPALYNTEQVCVEVPIRKRKELQGRFIENYRKANFAFTLACSRKFRPRTRYQQEEITNTIASELNRNVLRTSSLPSSILIDFLVEAAQRDEKELFRSILERAMPQLAEFTGTRLPHINEISVRDSRGYEFLEAVRVFLDDRLPVTFEQHGMPRAYIDYMKELAQLRQIEAEIRKYSVRPPDDIWNIQFSATKNITDSFYDRLAETCIFETCGDDFFNPAFQPLRMTVLEERWIIGSWYTLIDNVLGKPSLIIAGGGPQASAYERMDLQGFVRSCHEAFATICNQNELHGYYFAIGQPAKKKRWSDEGRIAQFPELRKALIPQNATVIELAVHEQVHFPRHYAKGPISRLAAPPARGTI